MKRSTLMLALLYGACLTSAAHAWSYVVVDSAGNEKTYDSPPVDLTYPPAGAPMPVIGANESALDRASPLSAADERHRLSTPPLIIDDLPPPEPRYGMLEGNSVTTQPETGSTSADH